MAIDLIKEQIEIYAKQLKIPTFGSYSDVLRQADQKADFGTLLLELMKKEVEKRQENQRVRLSKQAGFPYTKTLEELDLGKYKGNLTDIFVRELASCQFIKEKRNIVLFGNPGRGKTHLAIGLGLKACEAGQSVLFKNAATLCRELTEARDAYVLGRLEKKIQRMDLLIIDEMGYVSFDRSQSELIFKIVADRSERGSIIITTNLAFSAWTDLFQNSVLVTALIDRLAFKSHLIDMNGESYRLEQAKKRKIKQNVSASGCHENTDQTK